MALTRNGNGSVVPFIIQKVEISAFWLRYVLTYKLLFLTSTKQQKLLLSYFLSYINGKATDKSVTKQALIYMYGSNINLKKKVHIYLIFKFKYIKI